MEKMIEFSSYKELKLQTPSSDTKLYMNTRGVRI